MKTEILNLTTSHGATTAHVARPDNETTAAVILIHEWWGINDHIRDIAGRYAPAKVFSASRRISIEESLRKTRTRRRS